MEAPQFVKEIIDEAMVELIKIPMSGPSKVKVAGLIGGVAALVVNGMIESLEGGEE